MTLQTATIKVSLHKFNNTLILDIPVFEFKFPQEITWEPQPAEGLYIQAIALSLGAADLPDLRVKADPSGKFVAQVNAASPESSWQYLLRVNGQWFDTVAGGAFISQNEPLARVRPEDEPEEPPELVNGGPLVEE